MKLLSLLIIVLLATALIVAKDECTTMGICKRARGRCQPIQERCNGNLVTEKRWCRSKNRRITCGCCIATPPGPPGPPGCVFGETAYSSGAFIQDTCMILQCIDGAWNYTGKIDSNCGLCDIYGDPHVEPFDTHKIPYWGYEALGKNGTSFTITQPGIGDNPAFGVNSTVVSCPGPKPNTICIASVTYYQPGIKIILTVADPYKYTCTNRSDPGCDIQVSVNDQPLSIGTSVELIYGTTGTALIFQHIDPAYCPPGYNCPANYEEAIYCINIVGSEGLSVTLCVEDGHYAQLYVWATKSLQEDPPNYSSGLFGLCDTWTGTDRATFILRNGSTVPTTDVDVFVDSWIVTSIHKGVYAIECDCHLVGLFSGCIIINPAPPNTACKCRDDVVECTGTVVECKDPSSYYCKHPDTSQQSCEQAPGGNCNGY